MFLSSEYLRYKQNMERMRAKVKEREEMRKELEIKFKKLMKERNECEKTANVHKSKYDFLLEQERKRMIRNTELLHMLENIDSDGGMTTTRNDRLELLKSIFATMSVAANMCAPDRWRRTYQQLSSSSSSVPPHSNELPSRHANKHIQRRSASATRPFAYACPSSTTTREDIEIESIVSSENNNNHNQFSVSAPSSDIRRHQDNRNFMMNYNPIHLQRQIRPLSASVYRLSTISSTTTQAREPHAHYVDANDDDDDDLTATISTIAPINNKIISHRNSNAITPSVLSTYRHFPIVRRPFNDLSLQPYWKRNAETQTTNEIAPLAPTHTQLQTYYTNRYSQPSFEQEPLPRYQPSTLSRYRNYYGENDVVPLATASSTLAPSVDSGIGGGGGIGGTTFDRTNQFGYLANSTLPSWRSATELYKLPNEIQISPAANASENAARPYYSSSSSAIENVNQPRVHYQNQRNQFSFINESPIQQQQQQQQQSYSTLSSSFRPQLSSYALHGDGQPYQAMTSILPSTAAAAATAMDNTNAPLQTNSDVVAVDGTVSAPLSRDAVNGLLATPSNDRWTGQPTMSSTENATAKWIESRNDYGNQAPVYEYTVDSSIPDKSKMNEVAAVAAAAPNDKWSGQNNFQRQQIHAQVAQLADTQDPPKYVSAEIDLPYRATVYDYPPTPQQQQQSLSNVYDEHSQQQQQAYRRLSHDNYTASKSDDDLMMAKKAANGNEQRRYSVATHLYDYQQNYPKSEPILLPSATATPARRSSQTSDWNANETMLSRYSTDDDNVKDYSSEKNRIENSAQYVSENVRYDDGGGGGGVGGGGGGEGTQYAQSDIQQQQQHQPQTRSDRNDNFIENQMAKLALDEPQRDVEIESSGGDRNYSPNGKYSKTVTWADDPQMNFKRETETTPTYDSTQLQSGAGETPRTDGNQLQQQQQQLYQYENESYATETNAPIQYSVSDGTSAELQQSDAGDQGQNYYYGDGSTTAAGGAIDPATGVYYDDQSGQQMYQDQYYYDDGQSGQQPQQQYAVSDAQQDPTQSYYQDQQQYAQNTDTTGYVQDPQQQQQQYADGYQYANYPDQSGAAEPQDAYYQQTDSNYYQTEPGVNYYSSENAAIDPNSQTINDYSAAEYEQSQLTSDSRQYTDGSEVARLDDDNNSSMANYQSTSYGAMQQQQPSARLDKIPNYLQSDTEDSQSGGAAAAAAAVVGGGGATMSNVQSHVQAAHDSDFDFSTNS